VRPHPAPRTKRTRLVPISVLIRHAASALREFGMCAPPPAPRSETTCVTHTENRRSRGDGGERYSRESGRENGKRGGVLPWGWRTPCRRTPSIHAAASRPGAARQAWRR
jgi:hypothetical protein